MRILVLSTYELGHQPHHLALATAALGRTGHEVHAVDLSVDTWDPGHIDHVDAVAIAVPMHTAMRLAIELIAGMRDLNPGLPIALFGLYAIEGMAPPGIARFAGEFVEPLTSWADAIAANTEPSNVATSIRRAAPRTLVPVRSALPDLGHYAHLSHRGEERPAGYVEASTGCRHRCAHCPVPVIYDGRVSIADPSSVLADIAQQVEAGAQHITFGDPDFLNAPAHSRKVIREMHNRYPDLTFDATVKVEHILEHAHVWQEFGEAGCLFVVSAFETMSDSILARLDKGHTGAEAARAVDLVRSHGIEVRPSWLPFTPWTKLGDIVDVFRFISSNDLVPNTDPVQLAIRLLIPRGSLLLDAPDVADWLGEYDQERLSYTWVSRDPAVDELQGHLREVAENQSDDVVATFAQMRDAVAAAASIDPDTIPIPAGANLGRPRLMENWFC